MIILKNKLLLVIGLIFLVIPVAFVFSQSDGTVPPADGSVAVPTVESKPQSEEPVKPTESIPSAPSTVPTSSQVVPQNRPTTEEVPVVTVETIDSNQQDANSQNNVNLGLIALAGAALLSGLGFLGFKLSNKSKNKEDECDSIKDLIEQKKRQLEEEIRNYPEEKLKGAVKEIILNQLKKNEALNSSIEIAKDLQKKYNTSLRAIELLQKKYNLCILSLPTIKKSMQKITTHLWFDKEAKEASEFYVSVFSGNSLGHRPTGETKINNVTTISGTPSGDTEIISFNVLGHNFMAMSAGPYFKINQSISFMVNFDPSVDNNAVNNIDIIWNKLSEGGKVMMPIQAYPFSKRYGWVQDKYGVSWQLMLTNPEGEPRPNIIPTLLFVGDSYGKAEEFVKFHLSVFKDSLGRNHMGETKMGNIMKYGANQEPNKEGTVMFSDFQLLGQWFAAMDGGGEHDFKFNEAVSFIVTCKDQEEIDYYWEKLSAVPESEQCGWLKDKFGVSWQIVPEEMNTMMASGDKEAMKRVTEAFLKMKKFNIAELKKAYKG